MGRARVRWIGWVGMSLAAILRAHVAHAQETDAPASDAPAPITAAPDPPPPDVPRAPASEPDTPLPPPASSPDPPRPPVAPRIRRFFSSATWLASFDDAFPLLALGGGAPLEGVGTIRFGDPTFGVRTAPKVVAIDAALVDRWTLGGSFVAQGTEGESTVGFAARVGHVIPLGENVGLWLRTGFAHYATGENKLPPAGLTSRTDVTLDARLVWTVTPHWAVTLGPNVAFPIPTSTDDSRFGRVDFQGGTLTRSFPPSQFVRFGVGAGITARLHEDTDEPRRQKGDEPRMFLSIEHAMPLGRIREDNAENPHSPALRADGGTTDISSLTPRAPRLAFDYRFAGVFTGGLAASIGYARVSTTAFIPTTGAPTTTSWALAPRFGTRFVLSPAAAFWPRLGITYVGSSTERGDLGTLSSWHLGADLDIYFALSPARGVAILLGPTLEMPIAGAGYGFRTGNPFVTTRQGTTQKRETKYMSAAMTLGLVVALP